MIFAGEETRLVERPKVGDFLDDAQAARIEARVGADGAGIMRVDIAANTTGDEPFGHRLERLEQWRERALALLHQVQHRAPRRPRAERSEEHTPELQTLMRISDEDFCL